MIGALSIEEQIEERGVQRLCHATKLENLRSISAHGLISRERLNMADIPYVPNDRQRYDGRLDLISCTIEVPNAKYLWTIGGPEAEWVVFLVDAAAELVRPSTYFSAHNAARSKGRSIDKGPAAFASLFDSTETIVRGSDHHPACPTDLQAEALVTSFIRPAHVMGLVVASVQVARRHRESLQGYAAQVGAAVLVCPDFFEADRLIDMIQHGRLPRPEPLDL